MELAAETDERFKFPFFELWNFYAARNIAETLKEGEKDAGCGSSHVLDLDNDYGEEPAKKIKGATAGTETKAFLEQFTSKERRLIESAEHAGVLRAIN
uniref:JHD domain-containing protein n=1 Tax=Globodera pallida TaxID=36090 RepID=A0A183CCH6_GLOPA